MGFVSVLLCQPAALRRRLLRPQELDGASAVSAGLGGRVGKMCYVMGNASRMYEEKCISREWPHLDVAKTFVMQLRRDGSPMENFELEHMEVFLASLPESFEPEEAEEWLDIFERVKQYVFVALVDPKLHLHSTQIIKRFWCCDLVDLAAKAIEISKKTLIAALRLLYSGVARSKVDEAAVLAFLRDLRNQNKDVQVEVTSVLESFKDTYPAEYASSQLDTVFA